jgi:hypothetical protein
MIVQHELFPEESLISLWHFWKENPQDNIQNHAGGESYGELDTMKKNTDC